MIKLILILLAALFTMGQTLQPVDPSLSVPVLEGRASVIEFRTAHDKMYKDRKSTIESRSQKYFELLGIMTWELSQSGYTGIDDFTSDSELMNIKQLGFEDKEDFEKDKTISDTDSYTDMWH